MKEKTVTPAMIAGAVVVLALIVFVIYKVTAGSGGPAPKASDAPAYTKPGYAGPAPYGPSVGTPVKQNQRPSYAGGQGGGGYGRPGGGYGHP